jgi:ATP adenylyltransferase
MERLWAPWRIDYVTTADKEAGCFLCNASGNPEQDRRNYVLWRGQHAFCLLNRWPYNNGHLLVAPIEHKADLPELSRDELVEQTELLRRCQLNLKAVMGPAGFNIGLNLGQAAGAGVPGHLHWHIVPRWDADTNFMTVTADTRVIPQSLDVLWQLLKDQDGGA